MSRKILLILAGSLVLNLVIGVLLWQQNKSNSAQIADDGSVALVRPAFLDQVRAAERSSRAVTNIAEEAGVAAYGKTASTILLARAASAFSSISEQNSNYILGTITPEGYSAYWGVQVLVHRTGWIIAWYHKDWLASTIVHVNDKTFANKTKLSLAIDAVTKKLGATAITPSYYDFKYPSANRMVIARKSLVSGKKMRISYPSSFSYYDTSGYYEYATENLGSSWRGECASYANNGWDRNDWQNKRVGLFVNGSNVITQTDALPTDSAQYANLSSNFYSDFMNELAFNSAAGDISSEVVRGSSPPRCQTMAVVIVYRV